MGQDIRECCVQVSGQFDGGENSVRTVCCGAQRLDGCEAFCDDFAGVAFQEDFADEFGLRCGCGLGVGEVPGGVEGFGEGEVLFCYYAAGDTLGSD